MYVYWVPDIANLSKKKIFQNKNKSVLIGGRGGTSHSKVFLMSSNGSNTLANSERWFPPNIFMQIQIMKIPPIFHFALVLPWPQQRK